MRGETRVSGAPRGRRRLLKTTVAAFALVAVAVALPAAAGGPAKPGKELWQPTAKPQAAPANAKAAIKADKARTFAASRSELAARLAAAPLEDTAAAEAGGLVLSLPRPDGEFERFELVESPIMEPGLAAAHPRIKTYSGRSLDTPATTIRADVTPLGFHASVRSPQGGWYVDPYFNRDAGVYASYFRRDMQASPADEEFLQKAPLEDDHGHDHDHDDDAARDGASAAGAHTMSAAAAAGPRVTMRIYRTAIVSDHTYANYFGAANVTAAKVTLMNRVNHIYETESGIRMILIDDTEKTNLNTAEDVTGANGPCGAAPCFTPAQAAGCGSGTLGRNRIVLGQLVGASAYDVGHIVFGLNGGGIASLNSIGGNTKAQGCTGLPDPVGDFFAVDYVAHEIGHQFGSNHTFNGNQHNCSGGNRSAANSVEPGSGSSIMAYAGICRHDNLQPHTDPYWSWRSYDVIDAFVRSDRPAINEVQTVSLRDWNTNGQSFRLKYGEAVSAPIVRGTNYTAAAIATQVTALTGGTVAVAAWGGSGTFNDNGFQVTWSGANAARNLDLLELVDVVGGASGFVGETAKGGAIDNKGWIVEESANNAPTVSGPMSFVIPIRTPFELTGSAEDANGDELTYMWEQADRGAAAGTALANNVKTNGPLFRQFGKAHTVTEEGTLISPSPGLNLVDGNPTRVFPDLEQILAGNTNAKTGICPPFAGVWPETLSAEQVECFSEFLPTADYVGFAGVNASPASLNFRLTVRDSRHDGGGIGSAATQLILAHGAGPFLVTSQAAEGTSWNAGSTRTVTWDVANTDVAPVSAESVRISLSLDGGRTYPHVLAAATANDGTEQVLVPNVRTGEARIKVEALGNVFFAISERDFEIRDAAQQLADLVAASRGVGPGTSLEAIARSAAGQLAAGNRGAACNTLAAYLNEVRAQRGKTLTAAQATELATAATTIRSALGC